MLARHPLKFKESDLNEIKFKLHPRICINAALSVSFEHKPTWNDLALMANKFQRQLHLL